MQVNKKTVREIKKRVDKLKKLEEELKNLSNRWAIDITRLTIIKYLCRDPLAMIAYAYFLANKISPLIEYKEKEVPLKKIVEESIALMKKILDKSFQQEQLLFEETDKKQLWNLCYQLQRSQNTVEKRGWNHIRVITNWRIMMIEQTLECFIHHENPKKGYELSKYYTEKYDSSYGTGLIPKSLEYLQDVVHFWVGYYEDLQTRLP